MKLDNGVINLESNEIDDIGYMPQVIQLFRVILIHNMAIIT